RLVEAPLPAAPALALSSGAVLFTDDGRGVAPELAARLADLGQRTAVLRHRPGADGTGHAADLTSPSAVAALLERVRAEVGPVSGLIHLLPLAGRGESPALSEEALARRDVTSLYLLARGLIDDLRRSGEQGHAVLLAATGLGGTLGFGDG